MARFELAAGSTVGREHRRVGRNNQDAYTVSYHDELTVAVVADGCGSGQYSEVGAQLGVRLIAECLRTQYATRGMVNWDTLLRQVLARIDILVSSMGGAYRQIVEEYFLFTIVGVVIDSRTATFFECGDGTMYINGKQLPLGPYPGNAPPYIGYGLLEGRVAVESSLIQIRPQESLPVQELSSFLIGSDGIDDINSHQFSTLPGMTQPVGQVSQFWESDRYFSNTALVSRQLGLMGRDWPRANPEPGLLSDDTTIITGRQVNEYVDR